MSVKISERLTARLLTDLGLSVTSIERVRRGKHGKAAGTWAWSARLDNGSCIGSEDTMLECCQAPSIGMSKSIIMSMGVTIHANDR